MSMPGLPWPAPYNEEKNSLWIFDSDSLCNIFTGDVTRRSRLCSNAAVALVNAQRLESIGWQLKPWALLLGRLQIALGFDKDSGSVSVIVGRSITGQYFLHNVVAELPANEIEPFFSKSIM